MMKIVSRNISIIILLIVPILGCKTQEAGKFRIEKDKRNIVYELDNTKVGIYGTYFDFCDFSILKLFPKDKIKYWDSVNASIKKVYESGDLNIIGLYCFDRVKHNHTIEDYKKNADEILEKIDLSKIHAFFLNEENITWNNGIDILNSLYLYVKEKTGLPVYQWYSTPLPPHSDQMTDGWIIDPYGMKGNKFEAYLLKYLNTGKPVINCLFASPEGKYSKNSVELINATKEQIEICSQYDIPMFFYCVDPVLGSPQKWLTSTERETVEVREWLLSKISEIKKSKEEL